MNDFSSPTSQKFLRILSFVEGISLLILLFIAMPIKYIGGEPRVVSVVGMLHGLLFIALILMIVLVGTASRWSKGLFLFALVSSTLPFGMFFLDAKLKKLEKGKVEMDSASI